VGSGDQVGAQVVELDSLTPEQADAILRLADLVGETSGTSPLSDPVVGAVRERRPGRHFVQTVAAELTGYAHLDDSGEAPVAELLVGRSGDAASLLRAVDAAAGAGLRIWTRGDDAPLNDVLPGLGYSPTRTLLKLRRSLEQEPAAPSWPDGVTVREFRVGSDEAAWLAVNNAAFAGHPEQSGWTLDDITAREREPWFDPAGFFLAEAQQRLVGFHWTKDHGDALGEVYVIGVDPSMQGKRLGEALLLHGLRHLHATGCRTALLYVESDNRSALALYERLGFTRWDADRRFSKG
jgi:mycothiol synthase